MAWPAYFNIVISFFNKKYSLESFLQLSRNFLNFYLFHGRVVRMDWRVFFGSSAIPLILWKICEFFNKQPSLIMYLLHLNLNKKKILIY
jgi:hypothetical protein